MNYTRQTCQLGASGGFSAFCPAERQFEGNEDFIMVTRDPYRGIKRPHNTGMAKRADRRLTGLALAHAEKFNTSLAVDGSLAFLWNKVKGTTPCTCRGMSDRPKTFMPSGFGSGSQPMQGKDADYARTAPPVDSKGQFTYSGEPLTRQGLGRSQYEKSVEVDQRKPTQASTKAEALHAQTGDYRTEFDILDALEEDYQQVDKAQNGIIQPLGNASRLTDCPICFGVGTMDTWTLFNGERIILDLSLRYEQDVDDAEVEQTQPGTYRIFSGTQVKWRRVDFPAQWRTLARIAIFNKGKILDPTDYQLFFVHPSAPNTLNTLTYHTLSALNESALLSNSNKLDIVITTTLDELRFTHIEIVFSLGDPVRIQVPELEMADDTEFADWNLTATFEVPTNVGLRESSYVVEGKYNRVWKVTSINRKITGSGKSLGYTVNTRALHPYERAFTLLNLLGKPIDPFTTILDDILDDML